MPRPAVILLVALLCLAGLAIVAEGAPAAFAQTPSDNSGLQPLDPGRDPQMEQLRRDAGFGRFGVTLPFSVLVIAAAMLWAWRKILPGWVNGLLLLLLSISLVLGCCEVGFRLTSENWAMHIKIRSNCYHSNPRGYFVRSEMAGHPDISAWCVDSLEPVWEQCETPSPALNADGVRIMTLGDSFTDGVGVFRRDNWPSRLAALLGTDKNPELDLVNCGHADYDVVQEAQRLKRYAPLHDPKVLVLALTLNDIAPARPDELATEVSFQMEDRTAYMQHVYENRLFGGFVRHSALARFFAERWVTKEIAEATTRKYATLLDDPARPGVEKAKAALVEIRDYCRAHDIDLLVVLWPMLVQLDDYPFTQTHKHFMELLTSLEIPHADLLPLFAGQDAGRFQVHPTDFHPNEIAHRLAAERIADLLQRFNALADVPLRRKPE